MAKKKREPDAAGVVMEPPEPEAKDESTRGDELPPLVEVVQVPGRARKLIPFEDRRVIRNAAKD